MKCFISRWKVYLLAVTLAVTVLSGCGDSPAPGSGNSPGSQGTASNQSNSSDQGNSSSQTSSASQGDIPIGDSLEGEGVRKTLRTLVEGLKSKDADAIAKATNTQSGTYADWLTVDFTAISAKILSEDEQSGSYDVTFQVTKSDSSFFPTGTYTRHVKVGYPPFGDGEFAITTLEGPEKLEPYTFFENTHRPGYTAFAVVYDYLNLMETITFNTVEDIPDREIVDYALFQCAQALPSQYYYSKEDVQSMIDRVFNLPYFDATTTQYYDKAENRFELWGRGGYYRNYLIPTVAYDEATQRFTVEVRLYQDPLCTIPERTIFYTLGENSDESLYFISAIPI